MIKSKNNNHMYNHADASNAWATDTLKELSVMFFFNWAPYPMIHFKVMYTFTFFNVSPFPCRFYAQLNTIWKFAPNKV